MVGGIKELRITLFNLIEDWAKYNPPKESSERLADDWRFCTAYYKAISDGKEIIITYQGKKKSLTMEMLFDMATKIVKERIKREFVFHPREMKPKSLEFYSKIVERLEKEGFIKLEEEDESIEELDISPDEITSLGTDELIALRKKIHILWEERGSRDNDESSVNANIIITNEFKRRQLEIPNKDKLDEISSKFRKEAVTMEERAEAKTEREKEILKFASYLKEIVLDPDHISYSGGSIYAKNREPYDLDCIIKDKDFPGEYLLKLTRMNQYAMSKVFKDQRPIEYSGSLRGPNWRSLAAYDLVLRPKKKFVFKDLDESGFEKACYMEEEVTTEDVIKTAKEAVSKNKITPLEFFYAMKPTKPDYGEKRSAIERFVDFFDEEDFPVLASKKMDGINSIIQKHKDKIKVWTEQGQDITGKVPHLVEAIKKLPVETFSVLAELEMWEGSKHYPREATAGQINRKVPDDSNIIANIYTSTYMDGPNIKDIKGDIHELPEDERQEYLDYLKISQSTNGVPDVSLRFNVVPNTLVNNKKELRRAVSLLSLKPASEGVVTKKNSAIYYLDGNSRNGWGKYHLTSYLAGIIIEPIETKVKGTFNYAYALEPGNFNIARKNLEEVKDKEYVVLGKTFSSATNFKRGDVILIEFETFNFSKNKKDDTIDVSAWAPRVIGRSNRTTPETIKEAVARARKERVLSSKEIDEEGETHFIPS